jgi:hypothetical protein
MIDEMQGDLDIFEPKKSLLMGNGFVGISIVSHFYLVTHAPSAVYTLKVQKYIQVK